MARLSDLRFLVPWYVGFARGALKQRKLLALQFYIDDSGKNDPPVFVLAGFVASVDAWLAFHEDWKAALDRSPRLEFFKMSDANQCNGIFRGFSKAERDNKVLELASIIRNHVEFGVSIAIPHAAYDNVFKGRIMRDYDTPYAVAQNLMMNRIHNALAEAGNYEEVDVVFDRQLGQEHIITSGFTHGQSAMPPEIQARFPTAPIFADDKRTLPIQAADMLAWHIRRSWKEGRDRLKQLSAAGPILADEITSINELFLEDDLREVFALGRKAVDNLGTMFPHEAKAVSEQFDMLATAANVEQMEIAQPFSPVELVSFPAIGMGKYLTVNSCEFCSIPHLHKRLENRCLAEQTAVDWGFAAKRS